MVGPAPVQVIVAVKALAVAKTRLAPVFDAEARGGLVLAMLADTVDAALRCAAVASVHVVSPDRRVLGLARSLGVTPVVDPTSTLNAALHHGALTLDPTRPMAVLQADLPALHPEQLGSAVVAAAGARAAVADRTGTGTTLLLAAAGRGLDPHFGPGSADAHRRSGARMLTRRWAGLRTDVDTGADLALAVRLGLGAHTADHLARLPPPAHPAGRRR